MRRKLLIYSAAVAIFFLIAAGIGVAVFYSPLLTHYVESDAFRIAMEDETAKGLHFPQGHYSPIRRTSAFAAQSESFQARNGEKAMKSLDGRGITATFDPLGVFVRQWRFTDVRVQSGEVEIQIYKAHPDTVVPKPWFAIFLPNKVYLKRIETPQANITWRFRGERAGFFGTQLLVTPHGTDFEYVATSGRLKMALFPDLDLRRAHLLITKTLLTIYDIDLASDSGSQESIHAQANAGIGRDKSVDLRANFNQVPIRSWLPAEWKEHLAGNAFGDLHWNGKDPKLESSSGKGSLRVNSGRIDNLPVLEKLAELAQKKSFEHLALNDCSLSFEWKYPKIDINKIGIEERGKFRIEGELSIEGRRLGGMIRLGLTREYLDWLPNPEQVFSRKQNGYLWTNVRLFGTIDDPGQDLSPRIIELFKQSPGAYFRLLFRQFEGWLKKGFGGD
ncbi:MAG: hypothetical protein DME71_06405 [Verrucomicrobia bacterium]|nr:MAG: hypothetical protein DME71_06405 [Verrucomicrobiota bacterium]